MPTGIDYLDDIEDKKKKIDDKYKKRRDKELNDIATVLRTVEGRRLLWRILTESGLFRTTLSGNDPVSMSWREGKKDVGYLLIADIMESDINLFVQMQREYIAKTKQDEVEEKKLTEKEDQ